jgi:hypothetical protein
VDDDVWFRCLGQKKSSLAVNRKHPPDSSNAHAQISGQQLESNAEELFYENYSSPYSCLYFFHVNISYYLEGCCVSRSFPDNSAAVELRPQATFF